MTATGRHQHQRKPPTLPELERLTATCADLDRRLPRDWPLKLANHLAYIRCHIGSALINLADQTADGFGAVASGGSSSGSPNGAFKVSSVEAAVHRRLGSGRRLGPTAEVAKIRSDLAAADNNIRTALTAHDPDQVAAAHCKAAATLLTEVCVIIDRWTVIEERLKERLTCHGGSDLGGAIEWGNPLCENIAAPNKAGLCIDCGRRREVWRTREYRANGSSAYRKPN